MLVKRIKRPKHYRYKKTKRGLFRIYKQNPHKNSLKAKKPQNKKQSYWSTRERQQADAWKTNQRQALVRLNYQYRYDEIRLVFKRVRDRDSEYAKRVELAQLALPTGGSQNDVKPSRLRLG